MSSAPRSPSPLRSVHSEPMAIPSGGHHRARSGSTSSDSSEGTPPPMTPLNAYGTRSNNANATGGPGTSPTSPIMTMLAGQSPLKSPTAYPFSKMPFASAVDDEDVEAPVVRHVRRASINASSRFVPPINTALPGAQQERGANVLRRLSLGGTFGRASIAPEKPPSPPRGREISTSHSVEPAMISSGPPVVAPPSPKKRRGTMPNFDAPPSGSSSRGVASSSPPRQRRAPSPMGERILKGHFDSFH